MLDLLREQEKTSFPSRESSFSGWEQSVVSSTLTATIRVTDNFGNQTNVTSSRSIALQTNLRNGLFVSNNPVNLWDPLGLYWFRQPWQEPGVIGRDNTMVPPGGPISECIEQYVPAGYTFGQLHDAFVGAATGAGFPDWLVNIPSMPSAYRQALITEVLRSLGILEQPSPLNESTTCE